MEDNTKLEVSTPNPVEQAAILLGCTSERRLAEAGTIAPLELVTEVVVTARNGGIRPQTINEGEFAGLSGKLSLKKVKSIIPLHAGLNLALAGFVYLVEEEIFLSDKADLKKGILPQGSYSFSLSRSVRLDLPSAPPWRIEQEFVEHCATLMEDKPAEKRVIEVIRRGGTCSEDYLWGEVKKPDGGMYSDAESKQILNSLGWEILIRKTAKGELELANLGRELFPLL